jgi:hypothetical protein
MKRVSLGGEIRPNLLYLFSALAVLLLAVLAGCSSEPDKPAETAKPEVKGPELLTARSAFQKTFIAARGWNQDAKPFRIESIATSDIVARQLRLARPAFRENLHLVGQCGRRGARSRH